MRIIHISEVAIGGVASHLKQLVALQAVRYGAEQIIVLCPDKQASELDALRKIGVHIVTFPQQNSRALSALRAVIELVRIPAWRDVDIVHLHSTFAGLMFRAIPFIDHHKIVYCPHGWAFKRDGKSKALAVWLERLLAYRTAAIVCVSPNEQDLAVKVGLSKQKMRVIMNGLAPQAPVSHEPIQIPWPKGALRLLFVGRLDRAKGFDVFLKALRQTNKNVCAQVFGESMLNEYDGQDVEDLPTSCIIKHGWQQFDVIAPYLASCHAVVVPSRWEGLPYVALEAMRASKAVIISNVAGIDAVVEHDVTGKVFPVGDVAGLAAILNEVTAPRLEQMGAAGKRVFLEKFTDVPMEAAMHELYVELSD